MKTFFDAKKEKKENIPWKKGKENNKKIFYWHKNLPLKSNEEYISV